MSVIDRIRRTVRLHQLLLVLLILGLADYALAPFLWLATGLMVLQALMLPIVGIVLWRSVRPPVRAGPLSLFIAVLALANLVLLAKLELLLAGNAIGRVAAYRTFVVVGLVVQGVGLLLRGNPLERLLGLVVEHQARLMAISFGVGALLGALLLTLPQSLYDLTQISFVDALFTATTALCVTGLTVNVIGQTYTTFGQAVILGLMEAGGLGIMVLYGFFVVMAGQRLQLRRAVVMAEIVDLQSLAALRRTLAGIVLLALVIQGAGTLALYLAFTAHGPVPSGATNPWWNAVFHAVSAYTNAGLSLYHAGMVSFADSWSVSLTIAALIVIGGIGYPVTFELLGRTIGWLRGRRTDRTSLHARVVLWTTGLLIAGGTLLFLVLEWDQSMRDVGPGTRLLTALFQSVTSRTAGFSTLEVGTMAPATLLVTCVLMFIGASPGSTGGGIKTTTVAVLLATFRAELRHREQACLLGRAVPAPLQRRALGVGLLGIAAVVCFAFLLLLLERQEPMRVVFEVVSALSTTGLSTGITSELSMSGKLLTILAMLAGRIGPLTIALALAHELKATHTALPEEKLGIG